MWVIFFPFSNLASFYIVREKLDASHHRMFLCVYQPSVTVCVDLFLLSFMTPKHLLNSNSCLRSYAVLTSSQNFTAGTFTAVQAFFGGLFAQTSWAKQKKVFFFYLVSCMFISFSHRQPFHIWHKTLRAEAASVYLLLSAWSHDASPYCPVCVFVCACVFACAWAWLSGSQAGSQASRCHCITQTQRMPASLPLLSWTEGVGWSWGRERGGAGLVCLWGCSGEVEVCAWRWWGGGSRVQAAQGGCQAPSPLVQMEPSVEALCVCVCSLFSLLKLSICRN